MFYFVVVTLIAMLGQNEHVTTVIQKMRAGEVPLDSCFWQGKKVPSAVIMPMGHSLERVVSELLNASCSMLHASCLVYRFFISFVIVCSFTRLIVSFHLLFRSVLFQELHSHEVFSQSQAPQPLVGGQRSWLYEAESAIELPRLFDRESPLETSPLPVSV